MTGPEHVTAQGWLVVELAGRLDAHTAPGLEPPLAERARANPKLALDLHGLDYLSSAGLRLLLGVHRASEAAGGAVRLLRPGPSVLEVLEVSGFTSLFTVAASEEDLRP